MTHLLLRSLWRQRLLPALLAGVIFASGEMANAQAENKLYKNVRQYLSFDKLPERVRALITAAVNHHDNGEYSRSISDLNALLAGAGKDKPKRALRAWANQWLALNHFVLKDSLATVKKYVKLSIDEDVEIWREYAEFTRMPQGLREIYQEYWNGLRDDFDHKRHSWRLGLGTISRIDYSYRTEIFEILGGFGAPIVAEADFKNPVPQFKFKKKLLLYTRLQRVRRSIERIFGGYYVEYSLLKEDLSDNKLKFTSQVSAGLMLGYTRKTGWEYGVGIEAARLLFRKSDQPEFSQTTKINNWPFLYGSFELYVRKWF